MLSYLRPSVLALLVALALTGPPTAQAAPLHKHALLIGISNYTALHKQDMGPLFSDLHCGEDIRVMQTVLDDKFGFKTDGKITVLNTPATTTRQAILNAFDQLIAETQPGDLVYIHYSGHGSQVPDPTKPEGLESTIVPSDYKDDQTNEITGKEIGSRLARLKKEKKPVQIVLSFDSCHSGTISRGGYEKVRGISYGQYVTWYKNKYHQDPPPHPSIAGAATGRGANAALPELTGKGYVVLSACTNDQVAQEYQDGKGLEYGRLSYVLAQVLTQAGPQTTYQQVYDQIRARFRGSFADQSPQLDGNPNTTLMDGTAKELPPYILVSVAPPNHYILDAGSLQGMTVGSQFALYDKAATEFTPEHELAEATIAALSPDLTTAQLELTKRFQTNLPLDSYSAAHAVETRHNYTSPPLTLDAASVQATVPAQASAILDKLTGLKMVSTTVGSNKKPDVKMARLSKDGRGLVELGLYRGDDETLLTSLKENQQTPDLSDQIYSALQAQARYRYAVSLGNTQAGLNRSYHLAIRLVPAEPKKDASGNLVHDSQGNPVFGHDKPWAAERKLQSDDYFTIEVKNTSDQTLHLTVLDLDSNGKISPAWPYSDETAQENKIEPSASWVKLWQQSDKTQVALYQAASPDPDEIYKAIATKDYVSFKVLETRGPQDRGGNGPFDDLLSPAVDAGMTRDTRKPTSVDPGSWTAVDYPFAVLPVPGPVATP